MEDADQNCELTYMCSMHNANTMLIVLGYTCTEIITKL